MNSDSRTKDCGKYPGKDRDHCANDIHQCLMNKNGNSHDIQQAGRQLIGGDVGRMTVALVIMMTMMIAVNIVAWRGDNRKEAHVINSHIRRILREIRPHTKTYQCTYFQ